MAGVPFYAVLGYAAYLHSSIYRKKHERHLRNFLELPVSIGRAKPQTYHRVDFKDIRVWLPERRAQVFNCRLAEWHELTDKDNGFALVIRDGRLLVDSSQWRQGDYNLVLKSGLAHDFSAIRLKRVDLQNVDLAWRENGMALSVRGTTGRIQFDRPDEGRISVVSHALNDTATEGPIHVLARFRPSRDLVIHELTLRVPSLPVRALGLESVLGVQEAHGRFEGILQYREQDRRPLITLEGRAQGIELSDWTNRIQGGPLHGLIDLTIEKAEVLEQKVLSARFRGRAGGLQLAELTRLARITPVEGTVDLELVGAEFTDNKLVKAVIRGKALASTLDPIVALLGPGRIAGTLRVSVNMLELVDERVASADIDVEVVPPKDGPAELDTELIIGAARTLLGTELQPLIAVPLQRLKTVTYSRLAFKLLADHDQLRILGTHGSGGKAILTVRLFGTDLAAISQPEQPMELAPLIRGLRQTGEKKIKELMEIYQPQLAATGTTSRSSPTSRPIP